VRVIGVCGKGGSGKDTVANYLVEEYQFHRVAAADAMKVDLCKYLDMDLKTLESYKNIKLDLNDNAGNYIGEFSIRRFLQLYGMDMRYRIADTYWLERSIQDKVKELGNTRITNYIVVSDVRFEIEFDWIKDNGGDVIYVDGRTGLTENQSKHVSEQFVNTTAKDKCDMVIDNSKSLKNLYDQIEVIMEWQESK
jgi:dephospho-CoA kinase|tara:strand:- start:1655 stop:2236 length:582 start_codon:yes stop_codon:yes gene_type:complete